MYQRTHWLRILVVLGLLLVACGGGDAESVTTGGGTATTAAGETTAAAETTAAGETTATGATGMFATDFDAVVAAAAEEPPVTWCTGTDPSEFEPMVAAFSEMFPQVPMPEAFECSGEEATQRVLAEWEADATQVDVVDADTEILQDWDENNRSHKQDWSLFEGTDLEIAEDNLQFDGRFPTVGFSHRLVGYNTELESADTVPKTFDECADPKYKGRLAMDVRPIFFEMMEDAGGPWSWEYLQEWAAGVAANEPLWVRGSAGAYQALSTGERGVHCGVQIHGIFRGDRTDPDDPDPLVTFAMTDPTIVRDYIRLAIAPEPNAPNGAILFVAWMASNHGQQKLGEINIGYSSPFIEGTYAHGLYEESGVGIVRASQDVIASVSERMQDIILTEWGFPTAVMGD